MFATCRRLLALTPVVAIATLLGVPAIHAETFPVERQAPLLIRALAYDRNLAKRAGPTVEVGIVHLPNSESVEEATRAAHAFAKHGKIKIRKKPLRFTRLAWTNADDFAAEAARRRLAAVFVVKSMSSHLDEIQAVTRRIHVLTIGCEAAQVRRGLSLTVFPLKGKPTLMINLEAAKAEKISFSAQVLRVATVLRKE